MTVQDNEVLNQYSNMGMYQSMEKHGVREFIHTGRLKEQIKSKLYEKQFDDSGRRSCQA